MATQADALASLHRYRQQHPAPIMGLDTPPHVHAAWFAVHHLLPRQQVWRVQEGDLLVHLSGGLTLALGVDGGANINGRAAREQDLRTATIGDGLARALFELAASLWTNPHFLPETGPLGSLPPPSEADLPVPRGLEFVANAVSRPGNLDASTPGWLSSSLPGLPLARRQAFEQTVLQALRFLLLHELGHVCLGHLDLTGDEQRYSVINEMAAFGPPTPEQARRSPPDEARIALEIEADRFALARLFSAAHQRDASSSAKPSPPLTFTMLTLLGASLVPIVFHAAHLFRFSGDTALKHPPLWFRAHEAAQAALVGAATDDDLDAGLWAEQREVTRLLHAIGQTHPLLGEWLGPVIDGSLQPLAEQVLSVARHALSDFMRGRERQSLRILPA